MVGKVYFLDVNKNTIEVIPIVKLPFTKEQIINETKKTFDDDDPCIIHQTYANNQLGFDLLKILNEKFGNENVVFKTTELPDFLIEKLNLPKNVEYIKFE